MEAGSAMVAAGGRMEACLREVHQAHRFGIVTTDGDGRTLGNVGANRVIAPW